MSVDGGRAPATVTFLSDYGLSDGFVGVCHLVIAGIAPAARVVDLSHLGPPHDVAAGARALLRAVPWLTEVVLAVVDPGVATDRRPVALQTTGGADRPPVVFVGPDNGLLLAAAKACGGVSLAVALDDAAWHAPEPLRRGPTFDGRDVFAPVAAHLVTGVDLPRLGSPLDPDTLTALHETTATVAPDRTVTASVRWVDHFGNVQLDVQPELAARLGPVFHVTAGTAPPVAARAVRAYDDIADGDFGLVTDSDGWISLAQRRRSAANALGVTGGDAVRLAPATGQAPTGR